MNIVNYFSDYYLKWHVKGQISNYYLMMGMSAPDLEHKTLMELLDMVKKLLETQKQILQLSEKENKELKELCYKDSQLIDKLEKQNESLKNTEEYWIFKYDGLDKEYKTLYGNYQNVSEENKRLLNLVKTPQNENKQMGISKVLEMNSIQSTKQESARKISNER